MSAVWDETVNGFEKFVTSLKEDQDKGGDNSPEYLFTLTCFDTQIDTPIMAKEIDVNDFVKTFKKLRWPTR